MTPNRPPGMPPVPRDHADASFSEVVPFRSTKIRLLKSPVFILFVILAIVVPSLFSLPTLTLTQEKPEVMQVYFGYLTNLTVFMLLAIITVGIFAYARPGRSIWTYIFGIAVLSIILLSPIGNLYFYVFRDLLPGPVIREYVGFGRKFFAMLFGAGLCEELMKATPVLIGAFVARAIAARGGTTNAFARGIAVRGPLDGVLMGMFSAAAFIYIETALQYVPDQFVDVTNKTGNPYVGMVSALMLLLPRVLNGCVGHMAYSAVFGYFIGLGVVRPRQMWKLLAIGWVTASLLHALWNSVDEISNLLLYVMALLSGIGAAAVLLKARQLQAVLFGLQVETSGSILVDRRPAPPMPLAPQPAYQPPAYQPPVATAPPRAAEPPLALSIAGLQIPVRDGAMLDLGAEPALGQRGAGVAAAVVAHPAKPGVLGLRNTGATGWTAWLRDGTTQRIERDQNVRLAQGTRIEFAPGLVADVVARG